VLFSTLFGVVRTISWVYKKVIDKWYHRNM
jgi:hypothetical protein